MNIGILVPSNNKSGPQKLAAICALDLTFSQKKVKIFIPRFPYSYYFLKLRKSYFHWLKKSFFNFIDFLFNKKFSYEDIFDEKSKKYITIKNILIKPSNNQLLELDHIIIFSIAQLVELNGLIDDRKIIYYVAHPEEIDHPFHEEFLKIRKNFKGKIAAASENTSSLILGFNLKAPVIPNVVTHNNWSNFQNNQKINKKFDILFHYSLSKNKGGDIGNKIIKLIKIKRPNTSISIWNRNKPHNLNLANQYYNISEFELSNLYWNHKFFLFPSTFEGFGMPPIESLSYYCIPIMHENIGSSNLYAKDNINVILIKNDIETTVNRIIDILDNEDMYSEMITKLNQTIDIFNPNGFSERIINHSIYNL